MAITYAELVKVVA